MISLLFLTRPLFGLKVTASKGVITIEGEGLVMREEFVAEYDKIESVDQSLETLKVSGNIYSIDGQAFQELRKDFIYSVKTVDLGNIETVTDELFSQEFTHITKVKFGSNVRYIGENFMGTEGLILDIPATVERINPDLLNYIKSFKLDPNNKFYSVCDKDEDTYLLYANKSLIFGIAGTYEAIDLKIPDCITTLDTLSAYNSRIEIKSIDFNNVNLIKTNTFQRCSLFDRKNFKLDLGKIKEIENDTFIDGFSFADIFEVTLPASLEKIGHNAFPKKAQISLGENKNFKLVELGGLQFIATQNNLLLHLNPKSLKEEEYEYEIAITKEYSIARAAFKTLHNLKFKSLSIDCELISSNNFNDYIIGNLKIGSSVRKIEESTFSYSQITGGDPIPSTITEIGISAFSNAIKLKDGEAWCSVAIGTSYVSDNAFSGCIGIKQVTICASNVTLRQSSFSDCYNLESVKNDGGYIAYIGNEAFSGCTGVKKLELTDKLVSSAMNAIPTNKELYNSDGMFIVAETILVKANPYVIDLSKEKTYTLKVKRILDYAFYQYSYPLATFDFPDIEEIKTKAFSESKVKKYIFGKNLKEIDDALSDITASLIFMSDTITFTQVNSAIFDSSTIEELQLPKNIICNVLSLKIYNIVAQSFKINKCSYKFVEGASKKVDTLVLTDSSYSQTHFELTSGYHLKIESSVKSINTLFLGGIDFASVTINDGLEELFTYLSSQTPIEIPGSVKSMAYSGQKDMISIPKGQFVWEGEYLITKDKKTLCGSSNDADGSNIPESVEVFGELSLYRCPISSLPKNLKRIEKFALPGSTIEPNEKLEVIKKQMSEYTLEKIPGSLKEIDYLGIEKFNGIIDKSTSAVKLENNVWYWSGDSMVSLNEYIPLKVAFKIESTDELEKLSIDCDYATKAFMRELKEKGANIKEISLSERTSNSKNIMLDFNDFENLNKYTPPKYEPGSYINTAVKSDLVLEQYYETIPGMSNEFLRPIFLSSNAIPTGVLHIYIRGSVSSFQKQKHCPWIHVPKNLGLTPDVFGGMPIIYDQKDFVDEHNNGTGLSPGAIAGIVIGVIAVVAIIAFCVYWFVFRNKSDEKKSKSSSSGSP